MINKGIHSRWVTGGGRRAKQKSGSERFSDRPLPLIKGRFGNIQQDEDAPPGQQTCGKGGDTGSVGGEREKPGLRAAFASHVTASNKVINVGVLVPPVAFDPIPPSTSVDPVTRNPFSIMVRIVNVVAGNPNIAASVPPPVSRIPDVVVARRWRRGLNPYCRRGNPDNNFICRRLGRQAQHTADHYYPGKSTARASNPVITHT
jgi:hypothetical protein